MPVISSTAIARRLRDHPTVSGGRFQVMDGHSHAHLNAQQAVEQRPQIHLHMRFTDEVIVKSVSLAIMSSLRSDNGKVLF
jgi:hypothetical protein